MTELERTAYQLIEMWDLGYVRSVSVVNTTSVTRAFIELRDAVTKERIQRLNATEGNSQLSTKEKV